VSEENRIAAAQAHIDALVSHTATQFPSRTAALASSRESRTGAPENTCGAASIAGLSTGLSPTRRHRITASAAMTYAACDVLTKAAFGGRRVAARVNEMFTLAESPNGKAAIQHIKVRFQPFIPR
jgi:hypothetical protein